MKITSLILSLIATTTAQYYNITSPPFYLIVTSPDGSINDTLSACHTGAALESLCLSNSNSTSKPNPINAVKFSFNTTIYSEPPAPSLGTPGILTWILPASPPIPSSVFFSYEPTTDIALPILLPGDDQAQQLAFDKNEKLTVQGYVDWTVSPPDGTGGAKEYYRWYACLTYYSGYQYETLAWGLGPGKPENPSCVEVSVRRMFV
ncbi:Nn.00g047270.m01.CDS01 [Neocucurbitaria sp. VM-36]